MSSLTLTVHGTPAPMGSRIVGVRKDGTRFTRPASKRGVTWKETVADTAMAQALVSEPLVPPYRVTCQFFDALPKRPTYGWPVRGDIDKLVRGTLDGLKLGGVIEDDKHVIDLYARRFWTHGEPKAHLTITSLVEHYAEARAA